MNSEIFRLNDQEKELIQHFRLLSRDERSVLISIAVSQASRIEDESDNVVMFAARN